MKKDVYELLSEIDIRLEELRKKVVLALKSGTSEQRMKELLREIKELL